jgi:hypothetical protein
MEGKGSPIPPGHGSSLDGLVHLSGPPLVKLPQELGMVVGTSAITQPPGPDFLSPYVKWDVDFLTFELPDSRLEGLALLASRSVAQYRLVGRGGDLRSGVHALSLEEAS